MSGAARAASLTRYAMLAANLVENFHRRLDTTAHDIIQTLTDALFRIGTGSNVK
jgi:hypothetical protein